MKPLQRVGIALVFSQDALTIARDLYARRTSETTREQSAEIIAKLSGVIVHLKESLAQASSAEDGGGT